MPASSIDWRDRWRHPAGKLGDRQANLDSSVHGSRDSPRISPRRNSQEIHSVSRASGAAIELCISRRVVVGIDPERDDGWGFKSGPAWLSAGKTAKLAEGTLILAIDASYASARWYAGNFVAPTERYAAVYEVRESQLVRRALSIRRCWAQDLIGWICTNRQDVPTFKAFSAISAQVD